MRNSDFSGCAARLTGPASLRGRLGLRPAAGVLPAYLDRTCRRAAHPDPAGALRRRWPSPSLLPAAFTDPGAVRLVSGSVLIEAHWMWFIFITARPFISLSFQPRLAAALLRSCSVVNSLIRRAGLSPAFQPTSLAQRLASFVFGGASGSARLSGFLFKTPRLLASGRSGLFQCFEFHSLVFSFHVCGGCDGLQGNFPKLVRVLQDSNWPREPELA